MTGGAGPASRRLELVRPGTTPAEPARAVPGRTNHFEIAYDRIEEAIVTCALKPGRTLSLGDLQRLTGLGRTPVHQAATRFAEDTLIVVHPRQGLQIAPIDLARERVLLALRGDLERFVIRLATERASASHRNQMRHLQRALRDRRADMDVDAFNLLDRKLDRLLLSAAGEAFLEHALRPLRTMSRRIGWLAVSQLAAPRALTTTIDCHLAILDAVANRHLGSAIAASDQLIGFADSMFDAMEREIDPSLLDCSIEPIVER